jgi:sugar lactone lactonase YvrE
MTSKHQVSPSPRVSNAGCKALGVVLLLSIAGCTGHHHSSTPATPAAPLVWPAPPDPVRVAFVQNVQRPADIGIKLSTWRKIGHWFTGSEKGNEPLYKPFGLAVDENDNLCLTDTGANAVCFYDRAKKKFQRWDKIGKLRFVAPVAVAHGNGIFYVADSGLGRVIAFNEAGKLLFQITNHLAHPSGLALLQEQLFVADAQRHCIVIFDRQGNYRSEFGRRGVGEGQFNFPTHIAADARGNLLVTDSMNHRVQVLDTQGQFKAQLGSAGDTPGHFSRPKGVAVDSLGHIYVLDALLDNLQIFDDTGRLLLNLGETGGEAGEFWLPNGIAITRSNEIFVADCYNHRLQIFKYVGPS